VLTQPERSEAEPALPAPATPFRATVAGVGVIEPRDEAIAIGTNVPGIVTRVYVEAGEPVEVGAPLFAIDDRAARAELGVAEARVGSAEVALADARDRFERAQRSYERDATSDAEATRRRFGVSLAETQLAEARAYAASVLTEIERLAVMSPIAGRVWRVNVREGEFAQAGALDEPLLVVGDDSILHVRVEVDQTDAHRVREQAPAVGSLRGEGGRQTELAFVRFEPLVQSKRALTGDGTERVDTRVLEVIYALQPGELRAFVGQQMDVFIEADPLEIESPAPAADGPQDPG
jgi:RND family efflux transporter MFP subunit